VVFQKIQKRFVVLWSIPFMSFKKGSVPWNKGKKGMQVAWNKGKKGMQVGWNKGKHLSDETKKKLSIANKGKKQSAETIKKRVDANKGFKHSDKTKKQLSESKKGKKNPMYGKHPSEQTRKKMRGRIPWNKGTKGIMKSNSGSFKKGRKHSHSIKTREKLSESKKGKKNPMYGKTHDVSEDTRRKISDKAKIIQNLPERREFQRKKRLHQVFPPKDTKIEKILQDGLRRNKINFEKHKPILGQPDLFIEPDVCIFADGDYWHGWKYLQGQNFTGKVFHNEYFQSRIQNDQKISRQLNQQGYKVLRFWEHEIIDDKEKCIQKIIKAIKNHRFGS